MTPVISPRARASNPEKLLEVMLSTDDAYERIAAHGRLQELGYGGITIIDHACTRDGRPLVISLAAFLRHLIRFDALARVRLSGRRVHTAANCELGGLDDVDGYGPALGAGGPHLGGDDDR